MFVRPRGTMPVVTPRLSTFSGIVIAMYYRDHHPPHLHALSSGADARIDIETGEQLPGDSLPPRELELVRRWLAERRLEVRANWAKSEAQLPLDPVEPLS